MNLSDTFVQYFEDIKDPRMDNHNRRHELIDIFVITILGTICDANGWNEIYDFAITKEKWLKTFLSLPNGIPSHDTFRRVFSLIDPREFDHGFSKWIASLSIDPKNRVIAIDGKTLRGSIDRKNKKKPIHLVSAWVSEYKIMLAQVKTEEKSNEITAIPELLKMIDVKGAIVTIDAMGCQKKIAKQILKQEADFILSLKDNQRSLHEDVQSIFAKATEGKKKFKKMLHLCKVEKDQAHGRIERRRYTLLSARNLTEFNARWPGMNSIGMVESSRIIRNKKEVSVRFFITSITYEKINDFMRGVRKHWGIENNLHWSLDVSFNEDHSRIRTGNSSENLATVRRIALNLLKHESTHKGGITRKRKSSGWDHEYLLTVLLGGLEIDKIEN
jgi:predicted transposase YbfD/YdcC